MIGNLATVAHAFFLALGLILPLGPQNSLVLTAGTQAKRLYQTLPVVITAAACDSILIYLAIAGVSTNIMTIEWLRFSFIGLGVIFLVCLGWKLFNDDQCRSDQILPASYLRQITITASFSLLNPFALLDTIAVIGTSALTYSNSQRVLFTVTCIAVSWLWFGLLASLGQALASHSGFNRWRNKITGLVLWLSALALVFRCLQ